ncbi:hypothetical protein, partial [Enterococcus avium]|uniref:hypothetical protein n=1 Tax=Enterococcus avium TaxID=33945 RepID=UPI0028918FE0
LLEVPVRTLNLLNRRIRVRTYGGVRGAEGQLAFPSTRLDRIITEDALHKYDTFFSYFYLKSS